MQKSLLEKLSRKNILVIDDDGLITRTLCNLLQREGYIASGSESGSDAVKRIKSNPKAQTKAQIPVVFITGYSDNEAVERAKQLGEVIFKPFDNTEFLNRITKYLD